MPTRLDVRLTPRQLALVLEALDSHVYWQLSDPRYRSDGFVRGPGSDDPECQRDIRRAERLVARLEGEAGVIACPRHRVRR